MLRVFLNSLLERARCVARQFPVLLFHGFGEAGEVPMRIRVARRIKKMLEPRSARNPCGVKPIGFDLQQLLVETLDLLRRSRGGEKAASSDVAKEATPFFEFFNPPINPF